MTTRTHNHRGSDRSSDRRGVAMLLVIITLATATILTTTYLTSRSNSVAIGHTAASAASSEWAARSAARLTEAIFETDVDWRAAASDSKLLEGFAFGGADVEVIVTDTGGDPPDDDDTEVVVTVVAAMGGVSSTTQRIVRVRPPADPEEAVDPGLNEFGAFNTGALNVGVGSAYIGPWEKSKQYQAGKRPKVGFASNPSSDVVSAISNAAILYLTSDATAALIGGEDSKFDIEVIDAPVKGAVATIPDSMQSLPDRDWSDFNPGFLGLFPSGDFQDGDSDHALPSGEYHRIRVRDHTVVTIGSDGGGDYSFESVEVDDDGVLRIEGDVRLLAREFVHMHNEGLIELAEDATLSLYTTGDVTVDNAVIGFDRALAENSDRSADDLPWTDPRRIRIMQVDSSEEPEVRITRRSMVLGSLHQPLRNVSIDKHSAIAGRVSAKELSLDSGARVLLDPIFDNEMGLTSKSGPLYGEDGELIPELRDALENVDPNAGIEAVKAALLAALPEQTAPEDDGADEVTPRRADATDSWPYPVDAYQQERGKTDPSTTFLHKSVDTILVDTGVAVDNIVGDLADGLLGK